MQTRTGSATTGEALLGVVDELRARVDELEQTLEQRERLATLGTIAGLIAHEFNNILTPVISYSQMALGKPDDAAFAQRALAKSLEGSERAARIAEALLGFVREDAESSKREPPTGTPAGGKGVAGVKGKVPSVPRGTRADLVPIEPKPERTAEIKVAVERALTCLARNPASDGIELVVNVPAGLRAAIKPIGLEHAILNVLLNARSAIVPPGGTTAARGGGRIEIQAEHVASLPQPTAGSSVQSRPLEDPHRNGGWVVLSVRDTGRGMSSEQLARIFKPLVNRGDAASASGGATGGTGLGTTVCRKLVEDAGGAVRIESVVGEGTMVRLILPAVD